MLDDAYSAVDMLRELLELEDGLSSWEVNFIDSVYKQTKEGTRPQALTQKQIDCIEKIWNQRIG
jgi:hypothetical protein